MTVNSYCTSNNNYLSIIIASDIEARAAYQVHVYYYAKGATVAVGYYIANSWTHEFEMQINIQVYTYGAGGISRYQAD